MYFGATTILHPIQAAVTRKKKRPERDKEHIAHILLRIERLNCAVYRAGSKRRA